MNKINIFNVHYELVTAMQINATLFEHMDLLKRHRFAETTAAEFVHSLSSKAINVNVLESIPEVEFDIINDDLFELVQEFMLSKIQPPVNPREK